MPDTETEPAAAAAAPSRRRPDRRRGGRAPPARARARRFTRSHKFKMARVLELDS